MEPISTLPFSIFSKNNKIVVPYSGSTTLLKVKKSLTGILQIEINFSDTFLMVPKHQIFDLSFFIHLMMLGW